MPTERRLPQRHTGSMGMTVGGFRGQRKQETPNTVNIISLFWSIREAFVMATMYPGADWAECGTDHTLTTTFSAPQQVWDIFSKVFCTFQRLVNVSYGPAEESFQRQGAPAARGLEITVVFLY